MRELIINESKIADTTPEMLAKLKFALAMAESMAGFVSGSREQQTHEKNIATLRQAIRLSEDRLREVANETAD